MGSKQITLQATKDKIHQVASEQLEDRLEDISYYATHTALTGGGKGDGVDTGAYVTSFSLLPAGSSGGRSRTSNNKPTDQDPAAKKQEGYSQLLSDIQALDLKGMLESGNAKVTLRNRAPHASDVEDGSSWNSPGYGVFAKVRRRFG